MADAKRCMPGEDLLTEGVHSLLRNRMYATPWVGLDGLGNSMLAFPVTRELLVIRTDARLNLDGCV